MVSQYWTPLPALQLPAVQLGSPQMLATPRPPQVSFPAQPGQVIVPPQPSPIAPQ